MNREELSSPIYREVQQFRQVWIWVIVSALSGLVWYAAVIQLLLHRPLGGSPMTDILLVLFWLIFGIGLPALFFFGRLITEVRDDGIYIRFIPFHRTSHRIAFKDVKHFEVRTYHPFREYGGHSIRYGSNGKAYNVSGDHGVQIELLNGEWLLIGFQRANEFWRAIQAKVGEQAGESA